MCDDNTKYTDTTLCGREMNEGKHSGYGVLEGKIGNRHVVLPFLELSWVWIPSLHLSYYYLGVDLLSHSKRGLRCSYD